MASLLPEGPWANTTQARRVGAEMSLSMTVIFYRVSYFVVYKSALYMVLVPLKTIATTGILLI
jgi:hypothetical protein